jgi:transposase
MGARHYFLLCEREQVLLMAPSLRDWLPEDHLAWFVLASVEQLDLGAFYTSYRSDGHGRAAHDPAMMVALLVYAYARGQRSSRGIERACVQDVACRVIAANQVPDHATIARFRQRHEDAIADLFNPAAVDGSPGTAENRSPPSSSAHDLMEPQDESFASRERGPGRAYCREDPSHRPHEVVRPTYEDPLHRFLRCD